jgi:hypothetical protein
LLAALVIEAGSNRSGRSQSVVRLRGIVRRVDMIFPICAAFYTWIRSRDCAIYHLYLRGLLFSVAFTPHAGTFAPIVSAEGAPQTWRFLHPVGCWRGSKKKISPDRLASIQAGLSVSVVHAVAPRFCFLQTGPNLSGLINNPFLFKHPVVSGTTTGR